MCVIATVKLKVHSSSVSLMYVVHLCIIFSKAALQKRGSMEPMEPPLDPPLILQSQHTDNPQNICESSLSIATLKYICNDFFIHVLRVVSVLWL